MGTPIAWSDVTGFAPGLSTVASSARVDILAHVETALDPAAFKGECSPTYRLARIYLAAHMGAGTKLGGASGVTGPVTASAAGGMSKSFGTVGSGFVGGIAVADLARTVWGGYLLGLIGGSVARLPVVI